MRTQDESQRNMVLLTVDSFRADHCGFINDGCDLTPMIDRLAEDGVSYTQAIAPGPRTPSSVPVLFTGEFLSHDDSWTMENWQSRQQRIAQHMNRFTHLSEQLQRMGYETAAFTANPWTTQESNFHLGFNDFTEVSATSNDISSTNLSDSTLFKIVDKSFESLPFDPINWEGKKEWFSQWTGYFDLITEKVSKLQEPFFLWIFILDSHQPYITPAKFREERSAWQMYLSIIRYWHGEISDEELTEDARNLIAGTYRDAVRSVDAFVEACHSNLLQYDPVMIFHSDHGEAIGEHQNFGHERALYEENLRVPFFIHNAGTTQRVTNQQPLRRLPEILLDLVDVNSFDPTEYAQRFTISQTENDGKQSVRTTRWKYIRQNEDECLYDMAMDPAETNDVQEEYADVTNLLSEVLKRHQETEREKQALETVTAELTSQNDQL